MKFQGPILFALCAAAVVTSAALARAWPAKAVRVVLRESCATADR
jgi:hypothetical protein